MQKFVFSNDDLKKCEDFSNDVDTSFYIKRNQFSYNKRKLDSKIGKLGELIAYYYLVDKYPNITYPDFKIYKANEKTWDFDLKNSSFNLHVKTQENTQANKFGASWIFQYGNGKNRNYDREVFDRISPNQYVCFVNVNIGNNTGEIKAIVSLDDLHEYNLFAYPVLDKLKYANKLAVYYKDLISKIKNIYQL